MARTIGRGQCPGHARPLLETVLDDPQMRDTGFISHRQHPSEGEYLAIAHPVHYSDAPATIRSDPPLQGQHNREILGELGFGDEEIMEMVKAGALG
ncbi:MAG: CoA transferase [Nitratireductor sp.]